MRDNAIIKIVAGYLGEGYTLNDVLPDSPDNPSKVVVLIENAAGDLAMTHELEPDDRQHFSEDWQGYQRWRSEYPHVRRISNNRVTQLEFNPHTGSGHCRIAGLFGGEPLGKLFDDHPVLRFHASKTAERWTVTMILDPEISEALSLDARQAIETVIEKCLAEQFPAA